MSQKVESPPTEMEFRATAKDEADVAAGRRDFFVYRNFGVEEASNGYMRVTTFTAKQAMDTETGWHYHTCAAQLIYMIKGWAEVTFEDGETRRLSEGAVIFLPGGSRHNEIRTSDDYEALEVIVPGAMDTVPCDKPQS